MSRRISIGVGAIGAVLAAMLAGGPAGAAVPPQCALGTGAYYGTSGPTETKPVARFTVQPSSPQAGSAATFDGSASSDADGDLIEGYIWNFGDGTPTVTSFFPTTTHSYASPGIYGVKLTVVDCRDATGQTTGTVFATSPTSGGAGSGSVIHLTHRCVRHKASVSARFSRVTGFKPQTARILINGRTRAVIRGTAIKRTTTLRRLGHHRLKVEVRVRSTTGAKLSLKRTFKACR
jgi:hypothetical protein